MSSSSTTKRRGVVVESKTAKTKDPVPLLNAISSSFGLHDLDLGGSVQSRFEQLPDVILRRLFAFLDSTRDRLGEPQLQARICCGAPITCSH